MKYTIRTVLKGWVMLHASLFSAYSAGEAIPLNSAIIPQPHSHVTWLERFERFNRQVKKGDVDLVFIGDSITHAWEITGREVWNEFYGKRKALNLGIERDSTQNVLWRLDHGNIDGISPKLAVLLIGTNNAGHNTPQEIAEGVKAIVQKLRTKLPATRVLVLSIFPQGEDPQNPRRQVTAKANQLISKLEDCKRVYYLDIGNKFLQSDGTISRAIMPNFLHLSAAGYRIWAQSMDFAIATLLESSTRSKRKGQPCLRTCSAS
jgi:lysophospholipase L1-like esterase